ncbi:MAG: (2Fe-2S)-binding protein [Clostridia bacterium]|nr:(2Fe-2S)-binding protein [Clostridia bacterium]
MKQTLSFTLNHKPYTIEADPCDRFLDVLRNDLSLRGTKEGCGVGECGACTIVINGNAVTSCLVLAGQTDGADIMTVEGLSETEIGSVLQRCFIENGAVQCGFCTPGMLMSAYALLQHNPNPTREEIKEAIAGNLCRCTGYVPIVNSIEAAVKSLQS